MNAYGYVVASELDISILIAALSFNHESTREIKTRALKLWGQGWAEEKAER